MGNMYHDTVHVTLWMCAYVCAVCVMDLYESNL